MFDGHNDMRDPRLIGTWQSDRRRTMNDVRARRDITPSQRKKLASIFGKLTLRYTATRLHSVFDSQRTVTPYQVLAKNSAEVVVVGLSDLTGESEIHHIHFEGSHYWVCLGSFREYFRRVPVARRANRRNASMHK